MRSKNILYALMFASLCLATTGCDKELPLPAAPSGDSRGYRVPVFAAQTVGHVQPQDVSINSTDKNNEDKVVSLQVVSDKKITTESYYKNAGLWEQGKTNYITFKEFENSVPSVYYIANLSYNYYFSSNQGSNKDVNSDGTIQSSLYHCVPPFIMTAKSENLTYSWNDRKVYTGNGLNKSELKDIILERTIAAVDVYFKAQKSAIHNFGTASKITVDRVEVMNVPQGIGLMHKINIEDEIIEPDPSNLEHFITKKVPYYDNPDNFMAYYDGKTLPDFKQEFGTEEYASNFVKNFGNTNTVGTDKYKLEPGHGIDIFNKGFVLPKRIYLPENFSTNIKTTLRFTLTKITNDNNIYTRFIYVPIDKIERNNVYTYKLDISQWIDEMKFSVVPLVSPWTYVHYTENFDLDF